MIMSGFAEAVEMTTSDISRNSAVRLLRFYLKSTRQAVGLIWDSDNDSEVEMLIDYIIDATCQKIDEQNKQEKVK